ncbi:hypothetical protein OEZ86_004028 [Tetradesmus obliquus]|nr:hypothetical protein OEZ86_004028 [Tetradesmus obliquus]
MPAAAGAAAGFQQRKQQQQQGFRPPRLAGVDCAFCDRGFNTYASFDDCYVADVAFKPTGKSIQPAAYPALTASQPDSGEVSAAQASCPPAAAPGCPDYSGFARWEALYGSATASSDVVISSSVVLHGCAQPGGCVAVASITVLPGATLAIGDSALRLAFNRLRINGSFVMGSPACPIASSITVTVPGGNETYGVDNAGSYDVHGVMQGPTWTRISATVAAGSKVLPLQEAVQWQPGDSIVLVTTTWKDELVNQNEVLTVAGVSADGRSITTQQRVQFNHYGGEYQAEVGLLTRRILFTSDAVSKASGIGPHTTSFTPNMRISGAAFQAWGARNRPGRYSIHYHLAGNAPGAFVNNVAIYNSNWRCISIHGTNDVTLYGNVGFNIPGHCYYLEDGVEERCVLERNLAAFVHPIQTAGSGGGQAGTDRWQSPDLFDPSDSGASGFYSLNAYNTWLNNAASGGFSGFTFPHAPRAIKDHRNIKKADGFPFDPSQRPFVLFKGNTAHSTGYFWEHNAAVYIGGMLFYKTDLADGQVKLFYNNGRGSIQADPLCPDPDWPSNEGNNDDCWVGSARSTKTADGAGDGFLVLQDTTAALANVGVTSWGDRVEVYNLRGFDLSRGSEYLGRSFMKDSFFRVNTSNSRNGWSQWPFSAKEFYWESQPIKGFEWYDTTTTTILSNITFENYKYIKYVDDPEDWWYWQTPHAFRMLSHSDQFKPDKTMMVTKGISCINCDMGSCSGGSCSGGAFFRVDETYRGSSWLFNWLDADGSMVRAAQPSKPPGPYLIASQPDWWRLDEAASWREPRFGNPWVSPMPVDEAAARLEMRVRAAGGQQYTVGAFDGQDVTRIGYVSQFGDVGKRVVMTRTEGTTGMTGKYGWYTVWNMTSSGYHAPKRLELILFNVPRNKAVMWASCWPQGTTFTISKLFEWADCQNIDPLTPVASRAALLASGGNNFWVDANSCLHLKLTDPGAHWKYTDSFQRDGLYIEEPIRWYDLRYVITTSMACADDFFCPLPGNPTSRVPPAIPAMPPSCIDLQPPDATCGSVQCGWALDPGCRNPDVISNKFCQASCGSCPATLPVSQRMAVSITRLTRTAAGSQWRCSAVIKVTIAGSSTPLSGAAAVIRWRTLSEHPGFPYTVTAATTGNGQVTSVSSRVPTGKGCRIVVVRVTKAGFAAFTTAVPASLSF